MNMNRNFITGAIIGIIVALCSIAFLNFQGKGFASEEKKNLVIYVPFDEKFVCIEKINDEGDVVIRTRSRKSTDNIEMYLLKTYKHKEGEYLLQEYWNVTIEELTGMEPGGIKTCEDAPSSTSDSCFISTIME